MSDMLLNGRPATDFEFAAIRHGRRCDLERELGLLAGLLAEFPRPPETSWRPVSDLLPGLP